MKTPLEIARYTFDKMHSQAAEQCENEIIAHIESGIHSDRAQNPGPSFEELDDMLEEWDNYSGDVTAFIQRFVERWER